MLRIIVFLAALLTATPSFCQPAEGPRPVKIAVIDSGVARTPLLAPLLVAEYDMAAVFKERPAFRPVHDHGTEVATVIARNSTAPIELYSLRIDTPGQCTKRSRACSFLDDNMVAAIYKAIDLDVDVINLSTGGVPTPEMEKAIGLASAKGIEIAIAAGNKPGEPPFKNLARAGGKRVWLVGAIDQKARPCAFSARPGDAAQLDYQFVWRLGNRVSTQNMDGEWVKASGTSFATPILTAELASRLARSES